jgi:hypothetical protein
MNNDMVTLFEGGVHEQIYRFTRASMDENILGLNGGIEITNLFSERRTSLRFGISEPHILESLSRSFFEGKQVRNGHGFTVRGAEQEFSSEFVFGKITFEFEWRKMHREKMNYEG